MIWKTPLLLSKRNRCAVWNRVEISFKTQKNRRRQNWLPRPKACPLQQCLRLHVPPLDKCEMRNKITHKIEEPFCETILKTGDRVRILSIRGNLGSFPRQWYAYTSANRAGYTSFSASDLSKSVLSRNQLLSTSVWMRGRASLVGRPVISLTIGIHSSEVKGQNLVQSTLAIGTSLPAWRSRPLFLLNSAVCRPISRLLFAP